MKKIIWKDNNNFVRFTMELETEETTLTELLITTLFESEDLEMLEELEISNINEYKEYLENWNIEIKEMKEVL